MVPDHDRPGLLRNVLVYFGFVEGRNPPPPGPPMPWPKQLTLLLVTGVLQGAVFAGFTFLIGDHDKPLGRGIAFGFAMTVVQLVIEVRRRRRARDAVS